MTNLQINKELIDSMLKRLEKDKILEEYYEFVDSKTLVKSIEKNSKI